MKYESMMINPYLTFNGNCRQAMEFYRSVLGGDLELTTFADAPMEMAADYKDKILHSILKIDGAAIMASDGMPNTELIQGNAYSVSINIADRQKADQWFGGLSKGGKVIMPFEKTFWGALFGLCVDRHGIQWMINCQIDE